MASGAIAFTWMLRRALAIAGLYAVVTITGLAPTPALAHREGPAGKTDGISIPTLAHGRMQVIARHFADILDLADRQVHEDKTFQRLRNYISLQYAACLWGIMPASLADEESPFNECSHGYLSAAQALLLQMRTAHDAGPTAETIIDQIDREQRANDDAFILCRYSDEPFNTADVVSPHWSEIPAHAPSLFACIGLAGLIVAAATAGALGLRGTGRIGDLTKQGRSGRRISR